MNAKAIITTLVLFLLTFQRGRFPDRDTGSCSVLQPIALTGATIHTLSGDVIENGTIVFEDGKITAIGTNVTIPSGAST